MHDWPEWEKAVALVVWLAGCFSLGYFAAAAFDRLRR
jgi:hypothetical protein